MNLLSKPQRTSVVEWYFSTKSIKLVQRKFTENFGSKPPAYNTIRALIRKFKKEGSIKDRTRSGRPVSVRSQDNILCVKRTIDTTPTKSLRKFASDLSLSKSSVHRILKGMNYKPYKPTIVQLLNQFDRQRRLDFCRSMMSSIENGEVDLSTVLFSDESIFSLDRSVSSHNTYCWSESNPNHYVQRVMQPNRVVVWCALSCQHVIGPYFFESTVSAKSYLKMLREFVIPALRRRNILESIIFQQDGASPHTAGEVLDYLKVRFPNRLVSFKTDTIWPPKSPDLNPLDFYFWGHIKHLLKERTWDDMDQLKEAIKVCVREVNKDKNLLERVIKQFRSRLSECSKEDGGHFQQKL